MIKTWVSQRHPDEVVGEEVVVVVGAGIAVEAGVYCEKAVSNQASILPVKQKQP